MQANIIYVSITFLHSWTTTKSVYVHQTEKNTSTEYNINFFLSFSASYTLPYVPFYFFSA